MAKPIPPLLRAARLLDVGPLLSQSPIAQVRRLVWEPSRPVPRAPKGAPSGKHGWQVVSELG